MSQVIVPWSTGLRTATLSEALSVQGTCQPLTHICLKNQFGGGGGVWWWRAMPPRTSELTVRRAVGRMSWLFVGSLETHCRPVVSFIQVTGFVRPMSTGRGWQ